MMRYFQNEKHKNNVINFLKKERRIYKDGEIDCYYMPVAYLLLSTQNNLYKKTSQYMSSDGIDFETMMKEQDFSSGESKLVRLAANLFNGSMEVSPSEFIYCLDEDNFELAIQSIYFRRYGCHIENLLQVENNMENDDELEL
ncbi:DUF6075 family protein [Clostridium lundense]|uniref:DUF6075 family protein n=1 Tax=Clostridium lundense TaxID=319475 RepID=UPI000B071A7B|nr:DUF6075 family protein [Clostridium lundense]